MSHRRPFSEWTPLGAGFDVILSNDDEHQAEAAIDRDTGKWVALTDPTSPDLLKFVPTWFRVIGEID